MNTDLILLRLKSFGIQAGMFIVVAIVGAIASPEFREIVVSNAGTGIWGTLAALVLDGVVKHLHNLNLDKKLGSSEKKIYL